ncbi:organoarsenical effux MFS transporter ArsJ [Aliiroseovarius sp. 2305UL8-7]|uniref:organoarsenical effux MFS transporter ArsJ n=1 Tax=Aliiroseovarius conchicola TaxID=3121637 RepID=UPI0035287356
MSTEGSSDRPDGLHAYIAVTAAYWAFMLTDGALRMLVLLHFHTLGFSPFTLAWLFLLYEFAGIVTNLSAGWIAARFGLSSTLFMGLILQVFALIALALLSPGWAMALSVAYVMVVQGLSGVAKDLTKMSSKSAVKLLAPSGQGGLFKWVAILTGSKNAVKGFGFLLGAILLGVIGFSGSLIVMAVALAVILLMLLFWMPKGLPAGSKSAKFSHMLSKDTRVNRLSLARMFLFGARDVWFVVGVPVYFQTVLTQYGHFDDRDAFFLVGGFMAVWIVAYGAVQAYAPRLLRAHVRDEAGLVHDASRWAAILTVLITVLAVLSFFPQDLLVFMVVAGLLLFGFVFAVNSALHSYLILAFSTAERVTRDVGFYYMSNAAGRLLGTLLSGLSYQLGGLSLCLSTAAVMAALSWASARFLAREYALS